jgi:CheY-like chemotaxis protein
MPNPATVLVVEDDVSTQGLLVAVVRHLGLNARAADDGRAALRMIADEVPAVIILDLIMPEMDGFEVLRHFRRNSPDLLACTIVVTAASIRNADELPEFEYVYKFFRKPLDVDQFGEAVLSCAGQTSREGGLDGAYEAPPQP